MNLSRNGSGKPRGLSPSRIVDANNQNVAYAYQRASRMEQVGNVNLISAAPEMYAKLEEILLDLDTFPQVAPGVDHPEVFDLKQKIRKLLRKARGESEVSEQDSDAAQIEMRIYPDK